MRMLPAISLSEAMNMEKQLEHLDREGTWPGNRGPAWAKSLGERFNVNAAHHLVVDYGRQQIISAYRQAIDNGVVGEGEQLTVPRAMLLESDPEEMTHAELLGWAKNFVSVSHHAENGLE